MLRGLNAQNECLICTVEHTYGDQKFFSPPSILEPEIISESECSDMYA